MVVGRYIRRCTPRVTGAGAECDPNRHHDERCNDVRALNDITYLNRC